MGKVVLERQNYSEFERSKIIRRGAMASDGLYYTNQLHFAPDR